MRLRAACRVDGAEVDLDLGAGTLVALVGDRSAAVLTTLAGLRTPERGEVLLGDRPVEAARVGIALGDHPLVGALTARENVALRLLALGLPAQAARIDGLLATLRLPEAVAGNLVEQLSGGQQQRVAVARALAGAPDLICLDDPTSELDGTTAEAVLEVLRAAAGDGAIVVVAGEVPPAAADLVVDVG